MAGQRDQLQAEVSASAPQLGERHLLAHHGTQDCAKRAIAFAPEAVESPLPVADFRNCPSPRAYSAAGSKPSSKSSVGNTCSTAASASIRPCPNTAFGTTLPR